MPADSVYGLMPRIQRIDCDVVPPQSGAEFHNATGVAGPGKGWEIHNLVPARFNAASLCVSSNVVQIHLHFVPTIPLHIVPIASLSILHLGPEKGKTMRTNSLIPPLKPV